MTTAPAVARAPSAAPSGSIWGWVAALLMAILVGYYLGANGTSGGMVSLVLALLVIVAAAAFEAGKRGVGR